MIMASQGELEDDSKESLLDNLSFVSSSDNDNVINQPIDFSLKKPRRSYVMEDLGEVRHSINIKKWIMDQVELKLCLNKEELNKNLREKDLAIQKLHEELENLKTNKEAQVPKVSNLPKSTKSATYKKSNETDQKQADKSDTATLKRVNKLEDRLTTPAVIKPRMISSVNKLTTSLKMNSDNVKSVNREMGSTRGIYRSKTFRGETMNSKETAVTRNFVPKKFKIPDERNNVISAKRGLFGNSQGGHSEQGPNAAVNSKQTESGFANENEIAANLKRLTEEHARLQSEYARVRKLLMEANIKCASGLNSPVPPEKEVVTLADQMEEIAISLPETEKSLTASENLDQEMDDSSREGFRKEVLRLKEELLASQQQCRILSESKCQLEQDLSEREHILLQLSKQIEQRNLQHNDIILEKETRILKADQAIVSLQSKITEMEKDYNETKEFLQEENNTLSEALRDTEEKLWQYSADMEKVCFQLESKAKRCEVLTTMVDQAHSQIRELQSQLNETQDNAQNLIVKQGVELNEVSCAVGELHEVVLNIKEALLEDASTFGVEINSPERNAKFRRSNDGRRLVQAILEAASNGDNNGIETQDVDGADVCQMENPEGKLNSSSTHVTTIKEVRLSVSSLGKMCRRFIKFITSLVDEVHNEKDKLEKELQLSRTRMEDYQREVEDSCRKRWSIEEKNMDLTKELTETKGSLKDARDSLREMWGAIDEKASWLFENKKLREELAVLKKQHDELEVDKNVLLEEIKEIKYSKTNMANLHLNGNHEVLESKYDHLFLKQQVANMQRQIINKEEEFQDAKKKHERSLQAVNNNLHSAETEVHKLDKIIDHVLQVLLNAHDLEIHPVLQQLWKDLDGPGYVATKFDESATIV